MLAYDDENGNKDIYALKQDTWHQNKTCCMLAYDSENENKDICA